MKPIKKIAGELLLYFYTLQRKQGIPIAEHVRFKNHWGGPISVTGDGSFEKTILKIGNGSDIDVFNAINYLLEKNFIDCKASTDTGGYSYIWLKVSAFGIDIIEGIERSKEAKNEFSVNFNIKLADNINIDSLIKNELGSLIKASLI